MLHSFWHHQEITFLKFYVAVAQFHYKTPFYHVKQFIFRMMMVPGKRAFEFYQLHVLAIELCHNPGRPVFCKLGEFGGEIDFVHF